MSNAAHEQTSSFSRYSFETMHIVEATKMTSSFRFYADKTKISSSLGSAKMLIANNYDYLVSNSLEFRGFAI